MPNIPDVIVSKPAQTLQGVVMVAGAIFALAACGHFIGGNISGAFLTALIAWGALYAATKIKTRFRWVGGKQVYV